MYVCKITQCFIYITLYSPYLNFRRGNMTLPEDRVRETQNHE